MTPADPGGAYSQAFFDEQSPGSVASARALVPLVMGLVRPGSVVDVGCGVGTWASVFLEAGVDDVIGVDGAYVPRDHLLIPADRFVEADLAEPVSLGRRFDLAVSLEVGEHLPPERASAFVASLVGLADVVLFSAAIPGQGGTHHVNERWPTYWASLFAAHGFDCFDPIRRAVWNDDRVDWWYRQNILVFANNAGQARAPGLEGSKTEDGPMAAVHPLLYEPLLARATYRKTLGERLSSVLPKPIRPRAPRRG